MIALCHPKLSHERIAFVANEMKIPLQTFKDFIIQERFYNGWKHGHFTSHVFLFAPDGTIPIMAINAPGSMHDRKITSYGKVYKKLKRMWVNYGVKTIVDSAFGSSKETYLVKSHSNPTSERNEKNKIKAKEASSIGQMSEWGNQKIFKGHYRDWEK